MIQDLQWAPNGERFILISGTQPATATLYDKNGNPLFEFGKRYRNTIRICPFSSSVLIGGFGNLAGEVDLWNLDTHKEQGNTKAYCSVGVEWAPNGKYFTSNVLHERVKVDNEVRIYNAKGKLLCSEKFGELNSADWKTLPQGTLSKPDLKTLTATQQSSKEESKQGGASGQTKPPAKKWFNPAGGSNTFAQIMRQEMSKAGEKGPKKVDKQEYKDLSKA